MRRMLPIELMLDPEPLRAIALGLKRVAWRAKGVDAPTAGELLRKVLERTVDAWEHAGTVVLAKVTVADGRSTAEVCYAVGAMAPILCWYQAWEAECVAHHIDRMRIEGRKGWYRMAKRISTGFRSDGPYAIVKDLH